MHFDKIEFFRSAVPGVFNLKILKWSNISFVEASYKWFRGAKDILTNLKQIYMICSRFFASGNFNSNFVFSLGLLIGGWVNLKVFDWPFLIEA